VIPESTSPVGATEKLAAWLAAARSDLSFPQQAGDDADIQIAYCPERVLPGRVVHELVSNDRVIGGMTKAAPSRLSPCTKLLSKVHW
jgi:UDP-N-acetyl-D-mannosaminuronic acid dehydrogenase